MSNPAVSSPELSYADQAFDKFCGWLTTNPDPLGRSDMSPYGPYNQAMYEDFYSAVVPGGKVPSARQMSKNQAALDGVTADWIKHAEWATVDVKHDQGVEYYQNFEHMGRAYFRPQPNRAADLFRTLTSKLNDRDLQYQLKIGTNPSMSLRRADSGVLYFFEPVEEEVLGTILETVDEIGDKGFLPGIPTFTKNLNHPDGTKIPGVAFGEDVLRDYDDGKTSFGNLRCRALTWMLLDNPEVFRTALDSPDPIKSLQDTRPAYDQALESVDVVADDPAFNREVHVFEEPHFKAFRAN